MVAKLFDVFLSYASEDYDDVALPLKQRLEALDVSVWLDREQMGPGAFLASGLHDGLIRARCMLGVFSILYVRKHWTNVERNAAYALESKGRIHQIPVLHEMTEEELLDHDSLSAGRNCLSTDEGLDAVAARVARFVRSLQAVYSVYLVSTVTADDAIRADLQSALDAAGMTALAIDKVDGSIDVNSCGDHVGKTDLTVVIAAFRYGEPLPDEDRSTLEIACDGDRARLVLLPEKGTKVDPDADFDAGPDGPDYERQKRLNAFKRAVSKTAIEYMPETLAATLTSALREWRKTRDPEPDPAVPDARPVGFDRDLADYRKRIGNLYGTIQLAGFGTPLPVEIRLEDLFVPLHARVARQPGALALSGAEAETLCRGETDELTLTEAFWKGDTTRERNGLIILGDPGSGKTTHLRRLLLWVLEKGGESLGLHSDTVPLFLPLRELQSGHHDLREFVKRAFKSEALPIDDAFVDALVKQPHPLFLLDGLDEIFDDHARQTASRWICKLIGANPDARFAVTCRYAGYTGEARFDARFLELHLRPLSDTQTEDFVHRWYRIVETGLATDKEHAEAIGEARSKSLLDRLRQADVRGAARVYELTRNPLLLSAICLVHRDQGELPKKRALLYDKCVDALLQHWRRAHGVDVTFTALDARDVLKPVAAWMHREERVRATAEELAPILAPELKRKRIDEDPRAFLRTIRDQSGLLTGWGGDQYGFMHLGFQEYLASLALRDRAASDPTVLRDLAHHFGESWWREVTLLFLADGGWFGPLFRELIPRAGFVDHQDLVRDCVSDTGHPDSAPFLELLRKKPLPGWLARVGLGRTRTWLWPRQRIARVVLRTIAPERLAEVGLRDAGLEQRTKSVQETTSREGNVALVWIPEGELVVGDKRLRSGGFAFGKYPVTNEEYGRFLTDNADVKPPEYWGDSKFNDPRQPVVGVSWDEAVKFCEWAGGRLPTEEEWEFACRAGSTTKFWFGDDEEELLDVGWFFRNSGKELLPKETKHEFGKAYDGEWQCRPQPVGELRANPWGLYDVHGNVWEWCVDEAGAVREAGGDRVFRGGSFFDDAVRLRSSNRNWWLPDDRINYLGFRLAVSPPISE